METFNTKYRCRETRNIHIESRNIYRKTHYKYTDTHNIHIETHNIYDHLQKKKIRNTLKVAANMETTLS